MTDTLSKTQHFVEDNTTLVVGNTVSIVGTLLNWSNIESVAKGYILLLTVLITTYTAFKAAKEIFGKKKK